MWPTVINTMMGVRAIPQDYWNVAKVLRLSKFTTFTKIIIPATLPYMFTGYRLSLGIAWLVIVASEMLTGTPGVGGFLWQEYNSLVYAHILLAYYSLMRVARGFLLGIAIATPIGFLLGVSPLLTRMFDPIMQVLRPISPLAWLPLGLVLFQKSEPAALFAIAVCSMWPTVINTMMGVRAIPQDYWNVAKVLRLSRFTTFTKIIVPATLPYMFTGYRLSLGIAWLVIVASEMLTGTPGVGGFLWQEYNSLVYAHILLAIITIGVVGFVLDRLMGYAEAKLRTA
jgi:nitrate/nitrite transport system permease protein